MKMQKKSHVMVLQIKVSNESAFKHFLLIHLHVEFDRMHKHKVTYFKILFLIIFGM